MPASSFRLAWTLLAMLALLLEGVALGRPEVGDTLTESVRMIRFDGVGRYVLLPLWTWLTWHWIVRSESTPLVSWRDGVILLIGILLALVDAHFRRG